MNKPLVIAGSLLLAIALALLLVLRDGTQPASPDRDTQASSASQPEARAVGSVAPADAAPQATEASAETARVAATGSNATVRGRCVDEHGRPLAGCKARLLGSLGRFDAMQSFVKAYGERPEPVQVEAASGPDGTFELQFAPERRWMYAVRAINGGRLSAPRLLTDPEPGSVHDLGDVVLVTGVTIEGRIVDERGERIGVRTLALQPVPPSTDGTSSEPTTAEAPRKLHFQSMGDGSIPRLGPFLPGTYRLELEGRDLRLVAPTTIVLVSERPFEFVTIVVAESHAPRIRGRVLDERGAPVELARVAALGTRSGNTAMAATQPDGSFLLVGPDTATQPASLSVQKDGFEAWSSGKPVAWGTKDVEVRLRRGSDLAVRVVDFAGVPIPDFSVHQVNLSRARFGPEGARASVRGPHENGICLLSGLPRGPTVVAVGFGGDDGGSPFVEVVDVGATARLDLVAGPVPERAVRVVDGAGQPVVGTRVELCDGLGSTESTLGGSVAWARWIRGEAFGGLAVSTATTGADGRCTMRTRVRRELDLNVLGPGNQPVGVRGVLIDAGGELVVRVSHGARLVGRIVPADGMELLTRLGKGTAVVGGVGPPMVHLRAADGRMLPHPLMLTGVDSPHFVKPDGSFDIEALPAGSWRVVLRWIQAGANAQELEAGSVQLVEGQTVQHDIDVSSLVPGHLEASLRRNGSPPPEGTVLILLKAAVSLHSRLDTAGAFAVDLQDGVWTAILRCGESRSLRCRVPVVVRRGETTKVELDFYSGVVAVTVRDADGKPVPGFRLKSDDDEWWPDADVNGRIEVEVTARVHRLLALPWSLQQPGAMDKLWADARARGETVDFDSLLREVGVATVVAGQRIEVEVKLPRE